MDRLLNSFRPLLKKYKVETILVALSFIIVIVSLLIFFNSKQYAAEDPQISFEDEDNPSVNHKLYVDISGAVEKPDVYEATPGARLRDMLVMAGGLSADADRAYFARNFNLARIVSDQEKFYIPFTWEIVSGVFSESTRTLNYVEPNTTENLVDDYTQEAILDETVNINDSSVEELDTLPGVGKITAEKIINNRPYSSIEDLVNRKVVNKGVFEKIKNLITY